MRTDPIPIGTAKNDTVMPSGKHEGEKLEDIPADYLLWCYKNKRLPRFIRSYVQHNMNVLIEESNKNKS